MSTPGSRCNDKVVKQNGDPGDHLSVFTNTQTPAGSAKARLMFAFKKDTDTRKAYLAGREYYSEEGTTFELRLVQKIKQQQSADPTSRPGYPSSLGVREFIRRATEVALGKSSRAVVEDRVLGVQTPGFTAAVRLGAELLRHWYAVRTVWCGPVYLSSPCDDSLAGIFQAAGIQDIPSAHYPTGAALSQNQWAQIANVIMRRRLFPFFLLPPQALCYGDLEQGVWPVRYCASQGMELLCAQSFSHCFGLYALESRKAPFMPLPDMRPDRPPGGVTQLSAEAKGTSVEQYIDTAGTRCFLVTHPLLPLAR
uniref:aspartate transaminase n=1 Tax=Gasterosteus aculeatus aculeatus TaxID=481459 RepID=A0AAQ4R7N9_GASAC